MLDDLRRLMRSKELLYMLTWRDIRIRYKQSIMGVMWAILMPTLIVGAGIIIRVGAAKWSGTSITMHDIASVMVRAVAWAFFAASIRFGTNCLVGNTNLVTKIAFPKEVFPMAAVLSSLFDFCVATIAILIVLVILGWAPSWYVLWSLYLVFVLVSLATGLSLILSAGNLFFRDVKYIVEIFLTYAIFFTPVLYDADMLGKWSHVLLLNPVAPILEGLSDTMVEQRAPDAAWVAYSTTVAAVSLLVGYWWFKQLEAKFAERI